MTTRKRIPSGVRQYQNLVKINWESFQRRIGIRYIRVLDDVFRVQDVDSLRVKTAQEVFDEDYSCPRAISFESRQDGYFTPGVLLTYPHTPLRASLYQMIISHYPNSNSEIIALKEDDRTDPYFLLHLELPFKIKGKMNKYFQETLDGFLRSAIEIELHYWSHDFQRAKSSLDCVAEALASNAFQRIESLAAKRGEK